MAMHNRTADSPTSLPSGVWAPKLKMSRLRLHRNALLPVVLFISPLATTAAPQLTPFFFALIGISLIGAAMQRGAGWRDLLPRSPALSTFLLLSAYVLINATWSADPSDGLGKAALLGGLVLTSFAAVNAALKLDERTLRRAGLSFAAGALLGSIFMMLELLTDGIVTRTVIGWAPLLQHSSAKHVKIVNGDVTALNLSKLNQNVNLAMFHLWPGLLALMGLKGSRRLAIMLVFFLTIATVVGISQHDSSQVALLASSLLVILTWQWRRSAVRALAILWCAAFVLVIPASFAAYQSGLHYAAWLPPSARARVILWEYTAEQTLTNPILGVGVEFNSGTC